MFNPFFSIIEYLWDQYCNLFLVTSHFTFNIKINTKDLKHNDFYSSILIPSFFIIHKVKCFRKIVEG